MWSVVVCVSLGLSLAGDAAVETRWTAGTIPAIAVHLEDAASAPVVDARVVLHGPGGERFEGHTDADGSLTRVFLSVGYWHVTVYEADRPTHALWVELHPRQRADLDLVRGGSEVAPDDPLHPPVIQTEEANRGAVRSLGRLARLPL